MLLILIWPTIIRLVFLLQSNFNLSQKYLDSILKVSENKAADALSSVLFHPLESLWFKELLPRRLTVSFNLHKLEKLSQTSA